MVAEPGQGKQRHVGNGVLVTGSDKCQQTPPDGDEFGRAFNAQCHPDRQANQPVTQHAFEEQYFCRGGGFGQRHGMHQAGIHRQQATSAVVIHQRDQHRTEQVTQPGLWQYGPHLAVLDGTGFDAQHQKHGMAGEQL
ncbi:hypothetical protein D3C76_1190330 [compost metagenome]